MRVETFLQSTFFLNTAALHCQLVAMVLALRGLNIDRAFMTVGPGGVGQSLNSALIANVFGEMHAFVDMNIFFTDDELRKQADVMQGRVVPLAVFKVMQPLWN